MPTIEELRAQLRKPVQPPPPAKPAPIAWAEGLRWINEDDGNYAVTYEDETAPLFAVAVDKCVKRARVTGDEPEAALRKVIMRSFGLGMGLKGARPKEICQEIIKHRAMVLAVDSFPSIASMVHWQRNPEDGFVIPHGFRARVDNTHYFWSKRKAKWEKWHAES